VIFANPLVGLPANGWEQVAKALEHASSQFGEGSEIVGIENVREYVTPELAYIMEIERAKAKVSGREDIAPFALRVTMIFRPEEEGTWKVSASTRRPRNLPSASRVGDTAIALPSKLCP
jgi:ketosteroid isomerase-like protein